MSLSPPWPAVVCQRVSLACPYQLQLNCLKLLQCLRILVAFPLRLDAARFVASVLPSLGTATVISGLVDSFRLFRLSSSRSACTGSFSIRAEILARHSVLRLSDHQATSAAQRRSKFRHHLLRDVNTSAVLFVPGSRRCRFGGTSGFTIGRYLAGAAGSGSTSTRPSCKLQQFPSIPNSSSRFQRSSLFRLRLLRHATTAALLLTMCSPVLVLKPSQQPSIQFTASFCCGPVVLCGLDNICSPNAAVC